MARREAARKGGQARGRQQQAQARKAERETAETAKKPVEAAGVSGKTVAEIRTALCDELREAGDHERRHANRKTVLAAIESKLD